MFTGIIIEDAILLAVAAALAVSLGRGLWIAVRQAGASAFLWQSNDPEESDIAQPEGGVS
jgi:hypothetical protein